jgi:hypothetical protein
MLSTPEEVTISMDSLSVASTTKHERSVSINASIDKDGLSWPAIGSKKRHLESVEEKNARLLDMADSVTSLLKVR